MDSITQATLGAACGELVLGRRLGNKALVWGLVLGTLPDLDVVVYPWLDGVERLAWHRGLSHSALLCVVGAPLLGWLVRRAHGGRIPLGVATWFAFLTLTTHVLIDCFTVYGTQVLEPFAPTRVAWNNLFIIDPAFTLPMLGALMIAPWLDRGSRARLRLTAIGIGISTLYVLASFGMKAIADARFARAIADEGIVARRWMTAPMPLTTLYWRCLVDEGDRFRIAHLSVLDDDMQPVEWRVVPRHADLVEALRGARAFETVDWFSDGYWAARLVDGDVVVSDLRFGDVHVGRPPPAGAAPGWIFDFDMLDAGADLQMRRTEFGDLGPALRHVARRAAGMR